MNADSCAEIGAKVRVTPSTCCYCGVGCGVLIETVRAPDGTETIVGVRGDPNHPANRGLLCTKGSTLHLSAAPHLYRQTRATAPELRVSRADGRFSTRNVVDWDNALDAVAQRLAAIVRRDGPDAIGFYVSGQLLTEDYYVFNKLAKGLIGTNNIDTNSRLCMSSAVAGYKRTLGADAPPCAYEDIDCAEVLFISGSNAAFAHPVLFRRIEAARASNPQMKVIVVDPRRTDTAQDADLFLQIVPGSDVLLHHGLLHVMLWEGWVDEAYIAAHTEDFSGLKALVRDYTPAIVARACGITEADLLTAARWFATSRATLSLYCQGLNQSSSGTDKNTTLINLHLATGQIGKPGAGPFSLTGQPNAMGGREVGGLANLLSAHRDLDNPEHRAEVAGLWGVDDVPATPGLSAVPMFEALRAGTLKAIWVVCSNPAQSMPDQALVHAALERAEFVVVQEACAYTATARYADVLLPATTWGEKDGTVTNSERRISRVHAALPAFEQARHDWQIAAQVAQRLETLLPRRAAHALFDYADAEEIWNEHRASTRGRALDITGLSYARLECEGPQQWPLAEGYTHGTTRLYSDGCFATVNGRARFAAVPYRPPAEAVDARHPFALITGRLRDQWHGMSRTGTLARLYAHAPEPCIELAPSDLQRQGLVPGELLHVTSRRGSLVLPAQPSASLKPGSAFIAMHWGEEYVSGNTGKQAAHGVNTLTLAALDPVSQQPELKHSAIRLLKAELPWRLTAFGWFSADTALAVQETLRPLLARFAYGSCTLFGREEDRLDRTSHDPPAAQRIGIVLRLADYAPGDTSLLQFIAQRFALDESDTAVSQILRFVDRRRGALRLLRLNRGAHTVQLDAVLLAGQVTDMTAESWLRDWLETQRSVAGLGHTLLKPRDRPPGVSAPRGKLVCNCVNVRDTEIRNTLRNASATSPTADLLAGLQRQLGCGTQCGSCLPELRRLIEAL